MPLSAIAPERFVRVIGNRFRACSPARHISDVEGMGLARPIFDVGAVSPSRVLLAAAVAVVAAALSLTVQPTSLGDSRSGRSNR
jgi:hypothetical protein